MWAGDELTPPFRRGTRPIHLTRLWPLHVRRASVGGVPGSRAVHSRPVPHPLSPLIAPYRPIRTKQFTVDGEDGCLSAADAEPLCHVQRAVEAEVSRIRQSGSALAKRQPWAQLSVQQLQAETPRILKELTRCVQRSF